MLPAQCLLVIQGHFGDLARNVKASRQLLVATIRNQRTTSNFQMAFFLIKKYLKFHFTGHNARVISLQTFLFQDPITLLKMIESPSFG